MLRFLQLRRPCSSSWAKSSTGGTQSRVFEISSDRTYTLPAWMSPAIRPTCLGQSSFIYFLPVTDSVPTHPQKYGGLDNYMVPGPRPFLSALQTDRDWCFIVTNMGGAWFVFIHRFLCPCPDLYTSVWLWLYVC